MKDFATIRRLVVKVGTSTLAYETGLINIRHIEALVKVLSDLKNAGLQVVLVSSGAIGVGAGKLGLGGRPREMRAKQAAAAVGQCELMYLYDKLFSAYNHTVAQVLLTGDVVADEHRRANVVNTFECLLEWGAIPIVNENDTVSVEEIKIGDNDTLSAQVAQLVGADLLVLMSDIDGLYSDDPRRNPEARLVPQVTRVDKALLDTARGAGSLGTGGMLTKLKAARQVMAQGIDMVIVNGCDPQNLYAVLEGKPIGTRFISGGD